MEGLSQTEKTIWKCWATKTSREVVRESAAKGTHINLAKKFLQAKLEWDEETTAEWFTAEVLSWVLHLLPRRQFFKAAHVLNKINMPAHKHILDICSESLDRDMIDYVTAQLIKSAPDLRGDYPDEWKTYLDNWNLLKLLVKSFDLSGIPKQNNVFGSGKDIIVVTLSEIKELTIKKMENYSIEWKKVVTAYLFLETFDFSIDCFLDPEYLWKILLDKNMVILLRRWIALSNYKEKYIQYDTSMIDKNALKVDTYMLEVPEVLSQVDDLFTHWTVTNTMIDYVSKCRCFDFTKLCVHDALCAFGFVFDSEKDDLKLILRRLSRTQNLHSIDKIFSRGDVIFKSHLNDMLAKHSVEFNLFRVMTSCVERDLLKHNIDDIKNCEIRNCLDLWLLFKAVQNSKDTSNYTISIYETCKYLFDDNNSQFFSDNYLIIVSMVLLSDHKLFTIFNEMKSLQMNNVSLTWESSLNNALPHLYSVYQKWKNDSLIIVNDITVYQLLSGYKGLDISNIFEFQFASISTITRSKSNAKLHLKEKKISVGCIDEMPHFGNKRLIKKYAYEKKLNYLYYLKQNRPCMASQTLITQQYQAFRRLNVRMLREACAQAHIMALKNWNDRVVTSTCIAFIIMIGCDPSRCRMHITCAESLASHMENVELLPKQTAVQNVDVIMAQIIDNKTATFSDTLKKLQDIYLEKEKRLQNYTSITNFSEILYHWQTVVKFAYFHKLPLPRKVLQKFAHQNLWLSFLIFGDVFKYPMQDMLTLCRQFGNETLVQHLTQSIRNQNMKQIVSNNYSHRSFDGNEVDMFIEPLNFDLMTNDIWEVMAVCHGPEDPPGALIKASASFHCPILALLSTCYEPDAVDTAWAQWILTSLDKADTKKLLLSENRDASDMFISDSRVIEIMHCCIEGGYYRTLHESFAIFYKESPLFILLQFLVQTVYYHDFSNASVDLLKLYRTLYNRYFSAIRNAEGSFLPRYMRPKFVHSITIDLIITTLCKSFKSSWDQKEFLRCLCESGLSNDYADMSLDFCKLTTLINVSMDCNVPLNLQSMCLSESKQAMETYADTLVSKKLFGAAKTFANVANLCKQNILVAEWIDNYEKFLQENKENLNDFAILQFWTKCCFALKLHYVDPCKSVEFLKSYCDNMTSNLQKFYFLRLILRLFEDVTEDEWPNWNLTRDVVEFDMWLMYFSCEDCSKLYLGSVKNTYDYILNYNTELAENEFEYISTNVDVQPFRMLLREILEKSNVSNMSITNRELSESDSKKWINCLETLLSNGLIIEAWRLNYIFQASPNYSHSQNPVQIIEVCLQLVEGSLSPQNLPPKIRMLITQLFDNRERRETQSSEESFEELVLLSKKQEDIRDDSQFAGRNDANIISILDSLTVHTRCHIVKQIADYFRISIQVAWPYDKILKYEGSPFDLIANLSGRSRMPLAKIVFRAFGLTSIQIMEYLCLEIVTAIVSSHLIRTSGFTVGQREHFHYTVWGYPLDSDFEMFLNMRPEENSVLGRLILEYLISFRKLYKIKNVKSLHESPHDVEIDKIDELLDEEYQNIDKDEIEIIQNDGAVDSASLGTTQTKMNDNYSIASSSIATYSYNRKSRDKKPQFDVISCTNLQISPTVKTNIKSILKGTKLASKQINVISIELLVIAHECFSSVCDTEGIATILRSAQTLANHLLLARSWRLLVRLLTGIARYVEMAYIFQMLKDNDQFEFLLGQFYYMLGSQEEKINNFKNGLLGYLKKHCPGDTEKYCLVALHFCMYCEAADVKRKQARDLIEAVREMAIDAMNIVRKRNNKEPNWIILADNDSTRLLLETSLNHCIDGAELYTKGNRLGAAREMACLSQLIALQISLLRRSPTYFLLDINRENMNDILDRYLSFMEGLVYAHACEAFGGGWIVNWKNFVYRKVVKQKDQRFIKDIASFRPDIAVYIIERYDSEKNLNIPDILPIVELRSIFE